MESRIEVQRGGNREARAGQVVVAAAGARCGATCCLRAPRATERARAQTHRAARPHRLGTVFSKWLWPGVKCSFRASSETATAFGKTFTDSERSSNAHLHVVKYSPISLTWH